MVHVLILAVFLFLAFSPKIKVNNRSLYVLLALLSVFLMIRFGQGTDYFVYKLYYLYTQTHYSGFFLDSYEHAVEPFYYLLCIFSKRMELGFQFVVGFCSVLSCCFLYKAIARYSKNKMLSIFILYANYYFYLENLMRQSLAMSIALYAILLYVENRKLMQFIMLVFFAMMFHTVAISCLAVPLVLKFKWDSILNISTYTFWVVVCFFVGLLLPYLVLNVATCWLPRYAAYFVSGSFNIIPIVIRLLFSYIAFTKIEYLRRIGDAFGLDLTKLFLFGTLFYVALSPVAIFSRVSDFYTILEIVLFSRLFCQISLRRFGLTTCLLLCAYATLFVKDLYFATIHGSYHSNNPFKYPYVTIFNKKAIREYRAIDYKEKDYLLDDYKRKK